jgi:phosphotriesterase-related protein
MPSESTEEPKPRKEESPVKQLVTTLGPLAADELGVILPHEHVFTDLRTWDQPGYAEGDPDEVVKLMSPEIERARNAGVTAVVECSPIGVGRRPDILKAVSHATDFPLVAPTGVYRDQWIPPWVREASEEQLYLWMLDELQNEIEESGVQAGWVKLGASDNGITECEVKVLRAAARAGAETGAAIGSHTISGSVVKEQLGIVEDAGYDVKRFIWIHAQSEPNMNLEIARRGAWIEFDAIGGAGSDGLFVDLVRSMLDAGYGDRVLLSHDRGWYDPAQPGGGTPQPLTYLTEQFLPKLQEAGVGDDIVHQLTVDNPFRAFAR